MILQLGIFVCRIAHAVVRKVLPDAIGGFPLVSSGTAHSRFGSELEESPIGQQFKPQM